MLQIRAAQPPAFAPNCANPPDAATAALCRGLDLVQHATDGDADDDERDNAWKRAAESFRQAADLAREMPVKKLALETLEGVYDEKHLDRPSDAEPVLRELIGITPGDLSPVFRLARVEERQDRFDAAESTLLAAHQLRPDDIEPYRELAQFFARRAAALSAEQERQDRADRPRESGQPDKDGIYRIGDGVQPPEQISSVGMPLPRDIAASGIKGSVALDVIVREDGRVTDAKVLRSVPTLDAQAIALVRQWRFAPATLNGRPVPVRIVVVVNF